MYNKKNLKCRVFCVQEFGITECSTNYALFEVTVENGFVRQKRLADRSGRSCKQLFLFLVVVVGGWGDVT
jgi:hypothetical protein